jgi:hypothetical protein
MIADRPGIPRGTKKKYRTVFRIRWQKELEYRLRGIELTGSVPGRILKSNCGWLRKSWVVPGTSIGFELQAIPNRPNRRTS